MKGYLFSILKRKDKSMTEEIVILNKKRKGDIKDLIRDVRGKQVMLDSDIAALFDVEVKYLNRQMKRNINRFPEDFCFRLTNQETNNLRCQNVTAKELSSKRRYNPYVYTEHGIIALASVLKSDIAAEMSVKVVRAFVENRKSLLALQQYALGLTTLRNDFDQFKDETTKTFGIILKKMEGDEPLKEKLLLNGQYFDAYESIVNLIESSNKSIVLVDPYADDKSLVYLSHKKEQISVTIYKGKYSKLKEEEIDAFNKQFGLLKVKDFNYSHNRYLIIDSKVVYDLGVSLNQVGGKIFTISKLEIKEVVDVLIKLFN